MVKCIFSPEIDCPSYEAQKELGYEPNLNEIQEKACPQCPNGPNSSKKIEYIFAKMCRPVVTTYSRIAY